MTNQIPRHFGQVRGEEVVIAGHHKSMNSCLIVRLSNLPQDEAQQLRTIAMSTTAQNLNYLIPTLRVELHKSGQDWFTYLVTRLQRGDGSVINMPMKEIEAMNESQKSFFKGYGESVEPKGGPSSRVGKDTEFRTPLVDVSGEVYADVPDETPRRAPATLAEAREMGVASQPPTPATDPEMARVAQQQGGGASTQDQVNLAILETLKGLQQNMAELSAEVKKKSARKTTKRKTTRRKASSSSAPDAPEALAATGTE